MAVKMIFEMSPKWTDNSGWKRTVINKQIKRIILFLWSLFCVIMDLIQTLYVIVCFWVSKLVISCQNNKFRSIDSDYIYRISYKNAKKANPRKWICPILKTISQILNPLSRCWIHSSKDWSRLWYRIIVSQKYQSLDTWTLLQVSQVRLIFEYVGTINKIP